VGEACSRYWGSVEVYTGIMVGNAEGKRPLGRPRRRWEDNIKTGIQKVEC